MGRVATFTSIFCQHQSLLPKSGHPSPRGTRSTPLLCLSISVPQTVLDSIQPPVHSASTFTKAPKALTTRLGTCRPPIHRTTPLNSRYPTISWTSQQHIRLLMITQSFHHITPRHRQPSQTLSKCTRQIQTTCRPTDLLGPCPWQTLALTLPSRKPASPPKR
jgi:hypothetical protein